jgi:DNA-binding response OmpR family regulator
MAKILVVDDDTDVVDITTYALRRKGYTVVAAFDGQQALQRWKSEEPDLVLLDVTMPKGNGFDICKTIRDHSTTPVIMLTARDSEDDVVRGFQLGADDYLSKPYSPRQLLARIEAVLRRSRGQLQSTLAEEDVPVGLMSLNLQTHDLVDEASDQRQHLTPLEFRILSALAPNRGRVVSTESLVEKCWGDRGGGDPSMLKSHVCHLRRKIGVGPGQPGYIKGIPGLGYTLSD